MSDDRVAPTKRPFTQIFDDIMKDARITPQARCLYVILLSYRRKTAKRSSFVFPGQARLAAELGLNTRSVRTYLNELEAAGLIVVTQRGLTRTNIYDLQDAIHPNYQGGTGKTPAVKTD